MTPRDWEDFILEQEIYDEQNSDNDEGIAKNRIHIVEDEDD